MFTQFFCFEDIVKRSADSHYCYCLVRHSSEMQRYETWKVSDFSDFTVWWQCYILQIHCKYKSERHINTAVWTIIQAIWKEKKSLWPGALPELSAFGVQEKYSLPRSHQAWNLILTQLWGSGTWVVHRIHVVLTQSLLNYFIYYLLIPVETVLFLRGMKRGFKNCTCQNLSSAIDQATGICALRKITQTKTNAVIILWRSNKTKFLSNFFHCYTYLSKKLAI